MLSPAKIKHYYELKQKRILGFELSSPFWIYYCLQNPLLHRYNVDGDELLEGAKNGFEAVHNAISTKDQSQLREFFNTVSPENYKDIPGSVFHKTFKYPKLLHDRNASVSKVIIRSIITKIVGEKFDTYGYLDAVYYRDNPFTGESAKSAQELRYERDVESFPPGAVIAYMDVQYVGLNERSYLEKEMFQLASVLHDEPIVMTAAAMDKLIYAERTVLSFRACISGHVPLEWMLVDINGPRGTQVTPASP